MIKLSVFKLTAPILFLCITIEALAQPGCPKNSILYRFDGNVPLRNFTERLGNHPEFPFLQRVHGVTSVDAFVRSVNTPENQQKYQREFNAFKALLKNSGFQHGVRDLSVKNVEKVYISPGTIGNLGFYDKVKDRISYIYVRLNPAGEEATGIAAWKLTNKAGCFLYILHTCGNAFYPESRFGGDCCRSIDVSSLVPPLDLKPDSVQKEVRVSIYFYQGRLSPSVRRGKSYDTAFRLLHRLDTLTHIKTTEGKNYRIYANDRLDKILVCGDTVLKLFNHLLVDSARIGGGEKEIQLTIADTVYIMDSIWHTSCNNKWEIDADGGISYNAAPRLDNSAAHTQTDGAHPGGELAIGRIFRPWFMVGISAAYIVLAYQDDIAYPGSTAGTYNRVILGKPIIPVQLFARFNFGKQIGWQSSLSLSAGYSIPTNGKIESGGTTLNTSPALKGGFTAGVKWGLNYFFSCHFGLGAAVSGQFFMNSGALLDYQLMALPITAGIRYRF